MLVFWEKRLAFLATPKTASTAIETALESLSALSILRPPVLKHTSVQRFHRFLGPYLEAAAGEPFEVVALMREPVAWLGSWYRYRQRDELADPKRSTSAMTFDAFVQAWCRDEPPQFAAVGSQAKFLKPRQGKGVDRLFRYEEMGTFVDYLENRLNCEIILPRLNVSPVGKTDLSLETTTLLRRVAAPDFALYETLCPVGA
jgi:hypothetical protein